MHDLEPAANEVTRLLTGISDDHLGAPTPCEKTSVAGLLDHFMSLTHAFTCGALKTPPTEATGGPPDADHLNPDWRKVLPERLEALAQAWQDPSAWRGTAEVAEVSMPAEQMGLVALDELVMHGWDLARATGQEFTCDPASAQAVLAFTERTAQPGNEASREGLFGPVVPIPETASPFDRALGFAGRDPGWRSPARF
jgi:uncharacterized protein (TIGR03086 family)